MSKRILSWWSAAAIAVAAVAAMAVGALPRADEGAGDAGSREAPAGCRPASELPDPAAPQLDCPAPPNTFDVSRFFSADASAGAKKEAGPTYDAWAWSTFAALNWPAQADDGSETYPTGFRRGVPDLGASFTRAAADEVLVWETFKEKRELFQPEDTPKASRANRNSRWQKVTFDPGQERRTSENQGGIPPCSDEEPLEAEAMLDERGHHRIFFQGLKHPTADGTETLDEIVQVASQARESSEALCAGYDSTTTPTHDDCVNDLFPDGSEQALDARTPVGPRIWKGNPKNPDEARPVFFEVKVNYDFWRYILDHGLQLDAQSSDAVESASVEDHPKLPFRTSAAKGPDRSRASVFGYDADRVVAGYRDLKNPDALPGIGSVQLKAAWLRLDQEEIEKGGYHTTKAIYYRSREPQKDPSLLCYEVDTFGLLGLHIIQRVHSQPFDRTNPGLFAPGGTFVFATWEHESLKKEPSGFYYANYFAFPGPVTGLFKYPFTTDVTPFPNFARAPGGAIPVEREMPYPLDSTQRVNRAVHDQLPAGSIWKHYRLIGTQFVPVDGQEASRAFNQPYYLANLVVETNPGLQRFQGLPPGVNVSATPQRGQITPYYLQKVDLQGTSTEFDRKAANVVFNRELRDPVNMGGCMGCHGVAQLKGFNFSFVFSDGQAGADIDTQYHFAVAGGDLNPNDGN